MNDDRSAAIFGAFDGLTSAVGVAAGGLGGGLDARTVVVCGTGLAVAAGLSMGAGLWLSAGPPRSLRTAGVMAAATLVGSLVPVVGFVLGRTAGAVIALLGVMGAGCVVAKVRPGRTGPNLVLTLGLLAAASAASVGVAVGLNAVG